MKRIRRTGARLTSSGRNADRVPELPVRISDAWSRSANPAGNRHFRSGALRDAGPAGPRRPGSSRRFRPGVQFGTALPAATASPVPSRQALPHPFARSVTRRTDIHLNSHHEVEVHIRVLESRRPWRQIGVRSGSAGARGRCTRLPAPITRRTRRAPRVQAARPATITPVRVSHGSCNSTENNR